MTLRKSQLRAVNNLVNNFLTGRGVGFQNPCQAGREVLALSSHCQRGDRLTGSRRFAGVSCPASRGFAGRTQLAKPLLWLQKTVPNSGYMLGEVLGIAWG